MTLTQNYPQLKKIPQWLTVLLVILLGITLAKLFWMFLTPEEKIVTLTATIQNNTISKPKKQLNYGKIIAAQHLFGVMEKKVVLAPVQPKKVIAPLPVPVPKLKIKLFGIMSYDRKKSGYALLSYNGQAQKVYSVGERLDDKDKEKKVFISEVTSEKVIINNHGNLEEFFLSKTSRISGARIAGAPAIVANAKSPSSLSAPPSQPPASHIVRETSPPPGFMPPIPVGSPSSQTVATARSESPIRKEEFSVKNMAEFREKIMADPSKLMEIASARPYTKDGQLIGFRVRAGKRRRVFRQLGLRNGDIVKEVNGIKIDSPEKGIMLMGELSGASDLSITVLRGKREVQLPTLHF
jgi:general secretion pathway protein C